MRWRVPASPGMCVSRSVPGDAETPSGTTGEAVPEGDSEQAAREWADAQAANIGAIWKARYPGGRDW